MTTETRITADTPLGDPGVIEWLAEQDGWKHNGRSTYVLPVGESDGDMDVFHLCVESESGAVWLDSETVHRYCPEPVCASTQLDNVTTVGQLCKLVDALTGRQVEVPE